MDLNYNLIQEQKLIINQSMQQSLNILQMSNLELLDYVDKEIQENPVIEVDYSSTVNDNDKYSEIYKYLKENQYGSSSAFNDSDEEISPLNFISQKKSLKDYLIEQIIDLNENDYIKKICMYIVEGIDDRGYFTEETDGIASALNVDKKNIVNALKIVKGLEPAGIGAQNLSECLKLQAVRKGIINDKLGNIIEMHLEDIADNKYEKIAKKLDISVKEAQDYGDVIKTLEPKPSRGFYTGGETKYIIPDAYIERIGSELFVVINDNAIPRLFINNTYNDILKDKSDISAQKYVKEKINSAMLLVKSIDMRKNTLYSVLNEIVDMQRKYFLYEDTFLKPMLIKDIAERLNVHESTVSRAIKEKYIYTERGIIKIKDLFTNALTNEDNEDVSVKKIKERIKAVVDGENKQKPFSDQSICNILNKAGINISRRTVAKYREEMNIKSTSKRKRF